MENVSLQDWMYTAIFGAMAVLVIGSNVFHAIRAVVNDETTSFTLFIGGIFGAIAFLAAPVQAMRWFAILPALIDPGTGWVIYCILKNILQEKH